MSKSKRLMWLDAEANLWELSTREGVKRTIASCKAANIDIVIVDVKPLAGVVLYNSRIAPRISIFKRAAYPAAYDLLQTTIEEARKAEISVHAAVDVLSEGSPIMPGGPAFDHPDWQCIQLQPEEEAPVFKRVGKLDNVHGAMFVNPLHRQVRAYEMGVIREICQYDIDGIILDRMRYPNLYADFSDLTRKVFERSIGREVERWPGDILTRNAPPAQEVRGPLFKQWLRFRAQVMRDFLAEARRAAKSAKPDVKLGVYVGSWYTTYYDVGVNWGSPEHTESLDWWPEGYEQTGFADLVDYLCTGCYYPHPTRREAASSRPG